METLKLIKHTEGDDNCLNNVVNYPIGKDQVLKEGFGINPYDSKEAAYQFKEVAKFFNNQESTPVYHYMLSFTQETAPTAERAMELTKEIFEPVIENHLTAIGVHYKEREGGNFHTHLAVSPTDLNDGSLMYGDNATNCPLARRMAECTGQPTEYVIRKEDETEVKYPEIFVPQNDEDNE